MAIVGYSYVLLVLLPLLYLIKSRFYSVSHGLRLPPGPWRLPIIGSLHHLRGGLLHRLLRDLSRRYGPVLFLKFGEVPVVVVSSRDAAREIMRTHDAVFATRPQIPTIRILNEGFMGVVFAPYGDEWRQLRKICIVELLSTKRVQSFRPVREDEAMRLLQSVASSPEPLVNLSELLAAYMTDASVRCIMGDRFKERDEFLQMVEKAVRLLGDISLADLFPSSRLVQTLSPMARVAEAHRKAMLKLIDGIFADRMKISRERTDREDMMDVLLRVQSEDATLSTGAIKGLVRDLFAAGSEMAAITMQWAMAELLQNPEAMSKAQHEVRAVFSGKSRVTEEGLEELSYLHWVVKETLRLHPPAALLLPRECQEQCRILGCDVPKGAMVMINAWAISRDPEYWEVPDMFQPERFEAGDMDFKGNDFEFTPFGAGRRICPGITFAIATMELALASLLFHFDWGLPNGVTSSELDMTEDSGITTRKKYDIYLKATLHVPLPC